jgi:hypothetical protein
MNSAYWPLRGLSAARTPARHVSLENLVRLEITPRVLNAAARKRNHIGSVVINAQQFDWRSIVRKSVGNELAILSFREVNFRRLWFESKDLAEVGMRPRTSAASTIIFRFECGLENPSLLNRPWPTRKRRDHPNFRADLDPGCSRKRCSLHLSIGRQPFAPKVKKRLDFSSLLSWASVTAIKQPEQ